MLPIPEKLYNVLTWIKIALSVVIPLVIGLHEVWDLPFGYQIIQSLTIIEAAIIAFLKLDSIEFFHNKQIVDKTEG